MPITPNKTFIMIKIKISLLSNNELGNLDFQSRTIPDVLHVTLIKKF